MLIKINDQLLTSINMSIINKEWMEVMGQSFGRFHKERKKERKRERKRERTGEMYQINRIVYC